MLKHFGIEFNNEEIITSVLYSPIFEGLIEGSPTESFSVMYSFQSGN